MDENLSRGYIQLGKARGGNDFRFTNGFSHLSPPIDKCNCIYLALVLAGVGFLLPYNSFIIAVDYFQARYPGTTIVFDMSLVYIVMAFFAVLANNVLVETLSLNTRITFGYLVSFITLLFVATCEIWWEIFGAATSYTINLVAVAVVSLGCTGAAGFLVSSNRILTKLLLDDQRINTIFFFVMSVMIVALCFCLHQVVRKTDFVQFYITLCRESRKIVLEPTEDVGLMDPTEQGEGGTKNQYGMLKLQQSPLATDSATSSSENNAAAGAGTQFSPFSFSNPVYEPTATSVPSTGPTYKVEDVVVRMRSNYGTSQAKAWGGLRRGLVARWEVAKTVWPYMLSIGLAYCVTLSLYPGIESEIVSCKFGNWMPVILMAMFNAADLVGKILASVPYDWSRAQLIMFAWLRTLLIPLMLLCAMPRGNPLIPREGYPMLFSILLGVSNGLVGSVPMIQAPSRVPEEHRELTGNIMTLSYNMGLTTGSLVAYLLDSLLGPPLLFNGCVKPTAARAPTQSTAALTLAALTTARSPSLRPPTAAVPTNTTLLLASTVLATLAGSELPTLPSVADVSATVAAGLLNVTLLEQ